MKVVVVDDEPKIRNGVAKLITAEGYDAVSFDDPLKALGFLQSDASDVIITDIKMPELSGLELIARIRETDKAVKIIILSGYGNFSYAQKAIEMGVYRYLTKPTNTEELLAILKAIETDKTPKDLPDVANLSVAGAMDYIKQNYKGKIKLKEMADSLYISPNYLCALFKKNTGRSIFEFITEYRLKKATELLMDVKYKISDVSQLSGFDDTKYFSSQFKKRFGLTPMEYRNRKPI